MRIIILYTIIVCQTYSFAKTKHPLEIEFDEPEIIRGVASKKDFSFSINVKPVIQKLLKEYIKANDELNATQINTDNYKYNKITNKFNRTLEKTDKKMDYSNKIWKEYKKIKDVIYQSINKEKKKIPEASNKQALINRIDTKKDIYLKLLDESILLTDKYNLSLHKFNKYVEQKNNLLNKRSEFDRYNSYKMFLLSVKRGDISEYALRSLISKYKNLTKLQIQINKVNKKQLKFTKLRIPVLKQKIKNYIKQTKILKESIALIKEYLQNYDPVAYANYINKTEPTSQTTDRQPTNHKP